MIRRATGFDRSWMIATASEAFAHLGDYQRILPSWLDQPGVLSWVDEHLSTRRGLAVLAFYGEALPAGQHGLRVVADLLALAVPPPFQRKGLGSALLAHVLRIVDSMGVSAGAREVRLTVEASNAVAQRMYERAGFTLHRELASNYESGLVGWRMTRPLPNLPPLGT